MKNYYLKFVNGEELEIKANGYNVYHEGKMMAFYVKKSEGGTKTVANVMVVNILYITES